MVLFSSMRRRLCPAHHRHCICTASLPRTGNLTFIPSTIGVVFTDPPIPKQMGQFLSIPRVVYVSPEMAGTTPACGIGGFQGQGPAGQGFTVAHLPMRSSEGLFRPEESPPLLLESACGATFVSDQDLILDASKMPSGFWASISR